MDHHSQNHPSDVDAEPLRRLLAGMEAQVICLAKAKNDYLLKEAERKHFEASLIGEAFGKSVAERTLLAQADVRWLAFHQQLARLEALLSYHVLKLDVLKSQFQLEYLLLKQNESMIKSQI